MCVLSLDMFRCHTLSLTVETICKSNRFFLNFQVANPGQALQTLGSAFLNIMWPYELANEKWLLYPVSLKFEGHPDTQCSPTGALNPLKLQSSSSAEHPHSASHKVNSTSSSFVPLIHVCSVSTFVSTSTCY